MSLSSADIVEDQKVSAANVIPSAGIKMNLIVRGKNFDNDYERAHTLINRLPGASYSFQAHRGGFILVFEKGSIEEMEKLNRNNLSASLSARKDYEVF